MVIFESLTSLPSSDFPSTEPLHSLANGGGKISPHFSYYSLIDMWYFPGNTGWLFCGLIFSGLSDTFLAPSTITHTDATYSYWFVLSSLCFGVGGDTSSLNFVTNFIHGFKLCYLICVSTFMWGDSEILKKKDAFDQTDFNFNRHSIC